MTVKPRFSRPNFRVTQFSRRSSAWLDIGMLLILGGMLLKYWLSGQIVFLLHPDYVWLAIVAGFVLVLMAAFSLRKQLSRQYSGMSGRTSQEMQHLSLLPKNWSNWILISIGMIGLFYTPRPFASDIALQRGVTDTVVVTRSQPQAFRVSVNPAEKSITDWVRTLNVYPEPDAYNGQPVDVSGFVIHPPDLPENYLMISRFILTCCAADAYPIGLPVKVTSDRADYPADEWFRVKGQMITDNFDGTRRLTISATELEPIPQPKNPYDY